MKNRIIKNLENKTYEKIENSNIEGYKNINGWNDYYLSDNIVISHRKNKYKIGDFSERLHLHDYFELTIALSSEGVEYVADNQSISVTKGKAILSKPNKFHMFRLSKQTLYDRIVIYFKNPKDIFPDKTLMDFINKGNSSSAIFNLSEKQCDKLLLDLENALLKEKNYNNSKAYLVICNLFLTLLSLENDKETNSAVPHFINEIKEYVDKNYTTIRTVEELTKHFFYSREYISRSFRKYYNTPLYDYILERKISYCASLLLNGETVENASKNAGFNNISSFIKIFKKYYGVTPSEYKKKGYENS